jgi:hypothetical protein
MSVTIPTSGRGRWGADVCALSHPVRRNNAAMEVVMVFIIFFQGERGLPCKWLNREEGYLKAQRYRISG